MADVYLVTNAPYGPNDVILRTATASSAATTGRPRWASTILRPLRHRRRITIPVAISGAPAVISSARLTVGLRSSGRSQVTASGRSAPHIAITGRPRSCALQRGHLAVTVKSTSTQAVRASGQVTVPAPALELRVHPYQPVNLLDPLDLWEMP